MYDVAVIGGGPGGAVCARVLSELGHRVALFEAGARDRYKACAGGVPARNSEITPMKDSVIQRRITSMRSYAPNLSTFKTETDKLLGHIVFRADYDDYLRTLAQEAGCDLFLSTRIGDIEISRDQVVLTADAEGGKRTVAARAFVGAFGLSPKANLFKRIGIK